MSNWAITEGGVNTYNSFEKRIRQAHERLKNVYIEHRDYKDVITRYDRADSHFYLDPPYIYNDQRGKDKLYRHELTLLAKIIIPQGVLAMPLAKVENNLY